jgi:protein required for attachment to host cells
MSTSFAAIIGLAEVICASLKDQAYDQRVSSMIIISASRNLGYASQALLHPGFYEEICPV